ncbi:923_t:CDS:2 [Acaulospora morrowiae]|uniref:923_t:CDS:1 n=1 Tax=Acaulospora morrowiae TaxID=94023 RepID=A0A9N9F8V0_9GLOM|nr:923_t:CDS:2 [Acaulospora morrowiae]
MQAIVEWRGHFMLEVKLSVSTFLAVTNNLDVQFSKEYTRSCEFGESRRVCSAITNLARLSAKTNQISDHSLNTYLDPRSRGAVSYHSSPSDGT